jgi:transposase
MKRRRTSHIPSPPHGELPIQELSAIIERTRVGALTEEEYGKLRAVLDTLVFLKQELQANQTSIQRLLGMLFGVKTEKTRAVLAEADPHGALGARCDSGPPPPDPGENPVEHGTARAPRPGHGRNAATAYTGAHKVKITHTSLHGSDACPECLQGKVYPLSEPSKWVRIIGMGPLQATVYECDRLRCNLCGEVYTAAVPEGVGEEKYDASATAMVGLLKYGAGLPFHRIETLQASLGIPLPAATQWELVKNAASTLAPVHEELICQAASGEVIHNDDTTMQILQLTAQQRAAALGEEANPQRTGVFTSGIVAVGAGRQIALFFTGVRHAGENLAQVLRRRSQELPAPIQMCDGLSRNLTDERETLLSQCLAHSRRKFVEVAEHFPEQVRFVLELLREVYRTDARARQESLSAQERLELHQRESAPRMAQLKAWMHEQFAQNLVEPNSSLGKAIQYMEKLWDGLTLFLRVPGAPLDNNITEQALKKVILHRKNALFYRTLNGAGVGDLFMSLLHTAELVGANPFEYLVTLLRHPEEIAENPTQWMPWNYRAVVEHTGPDPPA